MFVLLGNELDLMSAFAPRIVVNTSLHFADGESDAQMQAIASSWATFIRTHHLEDRVLQATTAGNQHARPAAGNSGWSAAALRSDLTTPEGDPQPPLSDILVVENTSDSGAPAYQPGCLSRSSNIGGTIAAPGVDVYSNLIGTDAGPESGTSMSSPQVAGLGEYLWSINPELSAPQVARLIRQTAQPARAACQDAPVLDAYTATLGLDEPGCLLATCAPSRLAILDVAAPHGRFDQADVQQLADHIFATPAPADRDWSRFDLNGDGFTGGDKTAPFDLDTTGSTRALSPTLSTVTEAVHDTNGNPVQEQFDEHKVTDAEILCYYAYSSLYTPAAQDDQRDKILGNHCAPVQVLDCANSVSLSADAVNISKSPPPSSDDHPRCAPALNDAPPPLTAQQTTPCDGPGSCMVTGTATTSSSASAKLTVRGAQINASFRGEGKSSTTPSMLCTSCDASAEVNGDSTITFRTSVACTYEVTGDIVDTTSGDGTATAAGEVFVSGSVFDLTSGSGGKSGTLAPGTYTMQTTSGISSQINDNHISADALANTTGQLTLRC
jgi:subtilisin family serine protease